MKKIFGIFCSLALLFSFAPTLSAAEVGGYIDRIDDGPWLVSNSLVGWAYDPHNFDAAVELEIQIDGEYMGVWPVNWSRPDVGHAMGIGNNHGFVYPIDNMYFDGEEHTIRVYSVNQSTGGKSELGGSPFVFAQYDPGVTGYVDEIVQLGQDDSYWVHGWAFDNRKNDISVPIIAFNTDYASGEVIGFGFAENTRTDIDAVFGTGDRHGFSIELDLSGFTGFVDVAIYAIDSSIGELKYLGSIAEQL